jgi:hypothetical protein
VGVAQGERLWVADVPDTSQNPSLQLWRIGVEGEEDLLGNPCTAPSTPGVPLDMAASDDAVLLVGITDDLGYFGLVLDNNVEPVHVRGWSGFGLPLAAYINDVRATFDGEAFLVGFSDGDGASILSISPGAEFSDEREVLDPDGEFLTLATSGLTTLAVWSSKGEMKAMRIGPAGQRIDETPFSLGFNGRFTAVTAVADGFVAAGVSSSGTLRLAHVERGAGDAGITLWDTSLAESHEIRRSYRRSSLALVGTKDAVHAIWKEGREGVFLWALSPDGTSLAEPALVLDGAPFSAQRPVAAWLNNQTRIIDAQVPEPFEEPEILTVGVERSGTPSSSQVSIADYTLCDGS